MNVGVEGWLTDGCGYGAMANGQSEMLKSRKYLSRKDGEKKWNRLIEIGWTQVAPVWAEAIEP